MTCFRKYRNDIICALMALCLSANAYAQPADPTSHTSDYDGDGLGDLIVYDSTLATFNVRYSSTGEFYQEMVGAVGDVAVVADFSDDGKVDLGTFSRADGRWSVKTTGGTVRNFRLWSRQGGDVPVPGDYSGAGCVEPATYNKRLGVWTFGNCDGTTREQLTFGGPGMIAVPGDYDCDGIVDPAVFDQRFNKWIIRESSNSGVPYEFRFGRYADMPAQADWDGDSCTEAAIYRSTKKLFIQNSADYGTTVGQDTELKQWGLDGDRPIPVNVDGDNKLDFTVFRPNEGSFYISTSSRSTFLVPIPSLLGGYATGGNWTYGATSSLNPKFPGLWQFNGNRVLGDYDRDGLSDFVVAEVNRTAGTTTFQINDGQGVASVVVAAPGDAIVPGDYDGDGIVQPAVVTVMSNATTTLLWTIKNAYGADTTAFFGVNGDQPLVGDVNCDGRADKAVARNVNGFIYWWFQLSNGQFISEFMHGLKDDTLFLADVNGDGCDELVNSRVNANGGLDWYFRSVYETEVHQVQWGLSTDLPMRPNDVNGDGFEDFMVARNGNQRSLMIRYSDPRYDGQQYPNFPYVEKKFGLNNDISLLGDFSGVNMSEIAIFRRSGFVVPAFIYSKRGKVDWVVRHGSASSIVVRPDSTAVQVGGGIPGAVTPPDDPDDPIPAPGGDVESCPSTSSRGFLYKPLSQDSGPPREGFPMALLSRGTFASCIYILASNGEVISQFGRYSPNRAYEGFGCGAGNRQSAGQLAALARAANGSPSGYIKSGNTCYGPVANFASRHDAR